ncbi:MAG TPA: hypothetical protein PKW80_00125 [Bacteroidales bacterium]|nr:hypothetical protein [Bacteroidales bacterium]
MKKTSKYDPDFLKIALDILEINDYFTNDLPKEIRSASVSEITTLQHDLLAIRKNLVILLEVMEKMKVSCKDKYMLLNMVQVMSSDAGKYIAVLKEKAERTSVIKTKPADDDRKVKLKTGINIKTSIEDMHYTTLNCRYTASPKYKFGWWVNIYKPSYLVDLISGQRLEMISAFNIPLAPERHYLKSFGNSLCFTLVFPQIPKDWFIFKFVEGGTPENALSSGLITRNESGMYNAIVS